MPLNPYNDGPEYKRADDMLRQMSEYRGRIGEECAYVPSSHGNIDYTSMDPDQRQYYLWWRSQLQNGVCLRADKGYVRLRLAEIANSDEEPRSLDRQLSLLIREYRQHGCPPSDIAMVQFDNCMVNGFDLPKLWFGKGSIRSFMVTSELMSYPVNRINRDMMRALSGMPNIPDDSVEDIKHVGFFNDCLSEIDRFLHENTGKGIGQTFSEGLSTEQYEVYKYLPYGGDRGFNVSFERLRTDGMFGAFMVGLYTYTRKLLCKQIGEKGPSTPSSFNKEFRVIAERILKEGAPERERIPKETRGTERHRVSEKERMLMEVGAAIEAEYGPSGVKSTMNNDPEARKQHVSPHLRTDIDRFWNVKAECPRDYIPSGLLNPDYRSFTDAQREFYLYWREMVRKDVYLETDAGYVWLCITEMINAKADPATVMSRLTGLYRNYGKYDQEHMIGRACFDYALMHRLPIPEPSMHESNLTACLVMEQLLDGKEGEPDRGMLVFLTQMTTKQLLKQFDDNCVGIINACLREIQNTLRSEGRDIVSMFDIPKSNTAVEVYDGLKYYREVRKARVQYPDFVYNKQFCNDLSEISRKVIHSVMLKKQGRTFKVDKLIAFGIECKDIIITNVNRWFEEKSVEEIKERARNLTLDLEAVQGAHDDLDAVSRMMDTGYDRVEEKVEKPIIVKKVGDSWSGLAEALDDVQKGYLRSALEGKAKAFLKDNRLVMSQVEDGINEYAVDAVGDAIVEDGTVFDVYEDDVRTMLG